MLEASTRPAMAPGWWRRWPAWSPYAAMAWSVLYGALALSWAAGAPGFPFGEGDPEGAAMGSILFGLTRLAWALGIPLGIDQDLTGTPLTARIGEAGLATLAIGGGIVTLGLIRPWGRSGLAGSPSSPAAGSPSPFRPSSVAWRRWRSRWADSPSSGSLIEAMGLAPEPAEPPTYTGWATWTPGWLWPLWGIALALATVAYYHRRRHRGAVAAGPHLRQGTPR